jgi:pyrimidine deaminase RibD-like protein
MILDDDQKIVAVMNTRSKGWEHAARMAQDFAEAANERMATA